MKPGVGADALVLQLDVEVARLEAAGELLGPFDRRRRTWRLSSSFGMMPAMQADEPMMPLAVLLQHAEGGARACSRSCPRATR